MMVSVRRKAREAVLQALYETDLSGHSSDSVIAQALTGMHLPEDAAVFARRLFDGVTHNRGQIDEYIREFAPAWPLDQMAVIDRNILRLAIYELLLNNDVPIKVAINEAVELAKDFGADSAPRFINGVLSSVSRKAVR